MKQIIVFFFSIFAAAAFAGESTISVSGTGQVEVKPSFVSIQFNIQTRDRKQEPAQDRNLEISDAVMKLLKERHSIKADDIYTLDYRLTDDYETIDEKQVLVGYIARTVMKVNLRNIEKYRILVSDLVKAGVTGMDSIDFGYEKTGPYRLEALNLAYADARAKAEKLASLAGKSLGGSVKIEEIDTGYEPAMGMTRMKAEFSGDVISGGKQLVTAKVHIVFGLK